MVQPGEILGGRYKVVTLLAKGGMGAVYLVEDLKLNNKTWVIKEITQIESKEGFQEEAQMLTSLSHPNIPKITDYFEPNHAGVCYLVMEYIQGTTLDQLYEKAAWNIPLATTLQYVVQLCEVVAYLHHQETPIIFRDLKPANIMIDEFGQLRLIDFGIARKYQSDKLTDTIQMGTIAFAAPEQFENKQTDTRTDVYAVGTILYYLLTKGNYLFRNQGTLDEDLSHIPRELREVIQKLVETDPNKRFQDMKEVKDRLATIKCNLGEREEVSVTQTIMLGSKVQNLQPNRTNHIGVEPASLPMYTTQATQSHPALIIYLIDVSGSMSLMIGDKSRLEVVRDSMYVALKQMVFRSTKGSRISPRYRVAILAYSDEVYDLLGGIKRIDEVMQTGKLPILEAHRFSDTAKAFLQAEQMLQSELPHMQDCPAPLICHMTDGVFTGEDPQPIVQRIMTMTVKDGPVLVENIFISDDVLEHDIDQPKRWQGVRKDTAFRDVYGYKLRAMSSVIPESYRQMMLEANYNLAKDSLLMFPGTNPDLVSLGFQMSAATPIYKV